MYHQDDKRSLNFDVYDDAEHEKSLGTPFAWMICLAGL